MFQHLKRQNVSIPPFYILLTLFINSSFNLFLSTLLFSDLICQTKSLTIKVIYIKIITVKVNAIEIYIKNTHFITIKYNITKIFIKIEYIFICIQSSKKLLYHFACNKPIENKIQCWKKIINSFNTHFLSYIFIRIIF